MYRIVLMSFLSLAGLSAVAPAAHKVAGKASCAATCCAVGDCCPSGCCGATCCGMCPSCCTTCGNADCGK